MDLDFEVQLKPKKKHKLKGTSKPFPSGNGFKGTFNGLYVEIFEKDAIKEIYGNGCYGKGKFSRGAPREEEEPLVLQLEEAIFLSHFIGVLEIKDPNGSLLDNKKLLSAALEFNPNFIESMAAFIYLKSKNWVVKSGLKFGGDYVIYKGGPDLFHASFVVYVLKPDETEIWKQKNLKSIHRVAETSGKDVLLLEVSSSEGCAITSLEDMHQLNVAQVIVRRLKIKEFIQDAVGSRN